MTVKPALVWSLSLIAVMALAFVAADRAGWIDQVATLQTQAAQTGQGLLPLLSQRLQERFPRLGTKKRSAIDQALFEYKQARSLVGRNEAAFKVADALLLPETLLNAGPITPEQERTIQDALKFLVWSGSVMRYYVARIPNEQIGDTELQFGDQRHLMDAADAKRVLTSSSQADCTPEDQAQLRTKFSDEFLAMIALPLERIFLTINAQMYNQLLEKVRPKILAVVDNAQDREIVQSNLENATRSQQRHQGEDLREKQLLRDFFSNKLSEVGFKVYALAPSCFTARGTSNFIKFKSRLTSQAVGAFYLEKLRQAYAKTGQVPQDLYELRNDNPTGEREKFYSRPSDGWGKTFQVKVDGNQIQLISAGPDHEFGTADDFVAADGQLNPTL